LGHNGLLQDPQAASLTTLLASPDERVRAAAARAACPCHGSYDRLRSPGAGRRHSGASARSRRGRRAAKHALTDALVLNVNDEAA
jgi:hypothetical protein